MAQAIYIVEDESIVALDIAARVKRLGFSVAGTAGTAEIAVEQLSVVPTDLVLMDVQLRGPMDGIQAAEIVRERYNIPVVFLTAYSDDRSLERAAKTHAYGYLLKPFQERELLIAIQMALSKHEIERHLSQTRSLMDTTLNTLDVGVITTDSEANVQLMNSAAARITGWDQSEVVGKPLASFFRGESESTTLATDEVEWVRLTCKDGRRVPVELRRRQWQERADQPAPAGEVIVIRDVTQLREYQRNLIVAKDAAEAATRAKSEFLANMSHELRTPLNSIVGMAALVREQTADTNVTELLDILKTSADSLLELVNDVLDFSKVDSRNVTIKSELFSLTRTIEETVQTHRTAARAKRLKLAVAVDPAVPPQLYGDAGRIAQILRNLLSNAIKFTESGHVMAEAWCEPAADFDSAAVVVHIVVRDTGVGIATDQRERIFETFTQLDGSSRRSVGGTGLGLSIVRRLTELMKGTITVDSQPERGSEFHLIVPLSVPTIDNHPSSVTVAPVTALIVEDGLAARIMRRLLPHVPCTIFTNEEEFVRSYADGDVALDQNMLDQKIVLARVGESDDLQLFLGLDRGHTPLTLTMPFTGEALYHALSSDPAPEPVTGDARVICAGDVPFGSVLLVDDNAINRRVSAALVQQCGFVVEDCASAAAALMYCRDRSFDVCLLDIQMPGMDGFELLAQLRDPVAFPGLRSAAFVACTAHADATTRARAADAGFVGYLPKPYSAAQLELLLHSSLAGDSLRFPRTLLTRFSLYRESGRLEQMADLARLLQTRLQDSNMKEHMFRLALAARRKDLTACRAITKAIENFEGVEHAVLDS